MAAQTPDLTSLSLEEFLKVEVVSVKKGLQSLPRSAAAIHVIRAEDIRRSGARTLVEALRLAPGVHAARINGSTWAVGIRGYNGFYSRKLLVMIDGRTVYNPAMSGVLWNQQMIMMHDIDRIEVIQGPAGVMWGANAVNGVISVITRNAADTQGTLLAASADSLDPGQVSVRHGGRAGGNLAWRAWYQESLNGQAEPADASQQLGLWNARVAGVRADWNPGKSDEVMFQGGVREDDADIGILTSRRPPVSEWMRGRSGGPGGFGMVRWKHTNRRGDETTFQVFEDVRRTEMGVFEMATRSFDLDFQHSIALHKGHSLLAGGGFRVNRIRTEGTPDLWFEPANLTYVVSNAFLQDDWEIRPDRFVLTFGARIERYTLSGVSVQPTVRAIWTPNSRQAYWAAVSRAVRTPSHVDYAIRFPAPAPVPAPVQLLLQGSQDLKPESLKAIDAGGRWQAGRLLAIEANAFYYFYSQGHGYRAPVPLELAALQRMGPVPAPSGGDSVPVIPLAVTSGFLGRNRGGEISLYYNLRPGLRLNVSYAALFARQFLPPGFDPAQYVSIPYPSPAHQGQARVSWDFARRWTLDFAVNPMSGFRGTSGGVDPATRVDARLARQVGEFGEFFVAGQNLLYSQRSQFISDSLYPSGEIERSLRTGFSWRF